MFLHDVSYAMNQITHIMREIARLRIENAELRKNILIRKMQPSGEPQVQKAKAETMFSDGKGFEQAAGPDYGMNTRSEKFGFMSDSAQKRPPVGIGTKFFNE